MYCSSDPFLYEICKLYRVEEVVEAQKKIFGVVNEDEAMQEMNNDSLRKILYLV